MALKKIMYPGQVNSRETITTSALNATDTSLTVLDAGLLPDAPNLLVLGAGSTAETVLMTAKDGNVLTLQRGFQGVPKTWALGTVIARNFTEYDYAAMLENITDVEGRLVVTDDKVAANASAIGQIANERGYITSKSISDCNSAVKNGLFEIYNGLNQPIAGGFTWAIEVVASGVVLMQRATCTFGGERDLGRIFVRTARTDELGNWGTWQEIATSEIYTLIPLVGVSTAYNETPTLIKTGKICAIYGTVNLNSIEVTSTIFQKLPPQFIPKRGAEIFIKNLFPPALLPETRLFVNVDGIISIHGFTGTLTSISASFNGIWEV